MQACACGWEMNCGYYSEQWSINNDSEDRPCIFILINAQFLLYRDTLDCFSIISEALKDLHFQAVVCQL